MTRLVKSDEETIQEAAKMLIAGRLVAYPTDTVYGLGCDPFNADAVSRLVQAKKRVRGLLPVLVGSLKAAEMVGTFDTVSTKLANVFWPGALTIVVRQRKQLPPSVTEGSAFVGLRMPNHETALKLIERSGGAVIGTSANTSGHQSHTTAEEVLKDLEGRIDLVLDGGPTPLGRDSTVARVENGELDVIRAGAISRDDILKIMRTV